MSLVRDSALVTVVLMLGAGCHASPIAPPIAPASSRLTHPAGVHTARVMDLTGRPFAVRVSSRDVVYVTQQNADAVARFDLASLAMSDPIAVGADPGEVVFNRPGTTAFVSGFNDGVVHVVDVESGRRIRLLSVSRNAYRLALSRDETQLFVTSTDGRLYAVAVNGDPVARSVSLGGALNGLALSPNGETLIVASTNGKMWKVNATTLQIIGGPVMGGGRPQDVAIAPDGNEVYVANENGWVDVLDAATLERKRRIALRGSSPFGLAMTPDGAQVYVTSPETGVLVVIGCADQLVVKTIELTGTPRRIAFDRSGSTALIANEGNWVDIVR